MATALVVALCYFALDRPLAELASSHLGQRMPFHAMQQLAELAGPVAGCALLVLGWRSVAGRPRGRLSQAWLRIALAVLLTEAANRSLKPLFGRYWPETWVNGNPSWIGSHAYGFHPLTAGRAYESFPSGHAAAIAGFAIAGALMFPRWRWAAVAAMVIETIGLIGMDYHFAGDIVAGLFVGAAIARITCRYDRLPA